MSAEARPRRSPWRALTAAADPTQDPEVQRRARLLRAPLLVLIPSAVALIALSWLTAAEGEGVTLLAGGALIVVLLTLAWRLCGTRRYAVAAAIALGAITAVPIGHTLLRAAEEAPPAPPTA